MRSSGVEHDLHVVRPHEVLAEPVDLADEAHHELVGGVLVEVVGAARLLDPALVHHHQLLGDVHRLLLVVGDEDRRHVHLVVEVAQPGAQVLADLGVERAEGLVEQQHLRLDRERPGQGHALALAAGELGGVAVGEPVELDQAQQLVDPVGDLAASSTCGSSARRRRSRTRSCA